MHFKRDYQHHVRFTTEGHSSCHEWGCIDEGICRCYIIDSINIEDVNIQTISELLYYSIFGKNTKQEKRNNLINSLLYQTDIDFFAIDRILRNRKVYLNEKWNWETINNYYGDEVKSIYLNDSVYEEISKHLDEYFSMETFTDKVNFLLKIEYGYLLEELKNKSYEVVEVDYSDIHFPQKNHMKKSKLNNHYDKEIFKEWFIFGFCKKVDDKYVVIDGYHRLLSAGNKKIKKIKIINIC